VSAPPIQADDAELAVLGAVVIRNEALDEVLDVLEPEHFRREAHRRTFAAMRLLHQQREPIDYVQLLAALEKSGGLDPEMRAFVNRLGTGVPRTTNVIAYANQVREKALIRALVAEAHQVIADAESAQVSGAELLEQAEQVIYRLGSKSARTDWVSGEELAAELYPLIEQMQQQKGVVSGVQTGIPELDRMTRGFQRGDLVLVGARPSTGKTAMAEQFAMHAAERGQPVAFFSLEMGRVPLGLRAVTAAAQVDGFRLMSGYLSNVEMTRVGEGLSRLANARIWWDDTPSVSPLHVRSKLRRLRAKAGNVALVIIDYLQLMQPLPDDRRQTPTYQVAGISRALKLLAREFDAPFVVLSQLNRGSERSAEKRPTLSDLRDSGALEQDADVVLLLHRPEMYERDRPELVGVAELIIGKQRNGPTGVLHLHFEKAQTKFRSAS
jgi:replicative DNA helicase